ncbi:MAG: preprotein translocase subunit SecY [Patescibacteria group bacterium]|nr:preprotein translocase subunit SecY [Patescibacteria group bacterium]MBU1876951.1 preprotein translocase subunit SecY [Patescibacteria group bacterium]
MIFDNVTRIFKIKDLRNKILFILFCFAIFRLMANIPIPGVNPEKVKALFGELGIFGLLNIFTGGALEKISIVMLGVGPYITASIIFQLSTMIFPQLEKMYKEEGEAGRQKFNQYSRIATVPLAALQGYSMLMLFQRREVIDVLSPELLLASVLAITASSVLLMWLGELIAEKGIGEGVSLIIFAGIAADMPNNIFQILINWDASQIKSYILFFIMALSIIMGVVIVNEGRRNIPISYAKRVRGNKVYGGASTYLPLSINPAGVMPIIFSLSLLVLPSMVVNFLGTSGGALLNILQRISNFFADQFVYGISYFILVFLFTYFYTAITFDPNNIADNLKKMGGFVPGIRPGEPTVQYLSFVLNRVLPFGALFLGLIAVMPSLVGRITGITSFTFLIGGTSLLIVVSVILETMRQVNAQLQMREYDTF